MAKYIPIDPDTLEDYVDIWLSFALGLHPYIDEVAAKELMVEHLKLNKLTGNAAGMLGLIVKATATWHSKETH